MDPVSQSYMDLLQALHNEMTKTLDGASLEAVHWSPAPGLNSLAILANHVAGAERFWIGDVVAGEPSGRIRDKEFENSRTDPDVLLKKLESSLIFAGNILKNLSAADLAEQRLSAQNDKEFSVAWAIFHALEHTALHLGHMQLTRQLWDIKIGE